MRRMVRGAINKVKITQQNDQNLGGMSDVHSDSMRCKSVVKIRSRTAHNQVYKFKLPIITALLALPTLCIGKD